MRKSISEKSASSSRIIRRSSGFTLIELLIAILILAIIVAIAFSIYRVYIDKAKITVAESVLIDARKNLEVYLVDNKNTLPALILPAVLTKTAAQFLIRLSATS